jgi:hypothetical protein
MSGLPLSVDEHRTASAPARRPVRDGATLMARINNTTRRQSYDRTHVLRLLPAHRTAP